MATYEQYTPRQQEALSELTKEAQIYRRKADELKRRRSTNVVMLYEEDCRTKKALDNFEKKYQDITDEINRILGAREEMIYCVEKAKHYMRRAENIRATWDFK